MSLKHWFRVCGAVACLTTFPQMMALAAPWVGPGDARARYEAVKSADRGASDRTFTTWPVMWPNIEKKAGYLNFEYDKTGAPDSRAEMTIAGQTETPFVSGFEPVLSGDGRVAFTAQWQWNRWAVGVSGSGIADEDDNQSVRADGSYVATTLGNWVLGAGQIDRWWGPGWHSSLILSNNARPIPAFFINRSDARAPSSDWLSWIGPWDFTMMAGQLEGRRAQPDAKYLGMRLTFRPVSGLDIGLSRAIIFGGRHRPESGSVILDALIGRDNSQDGADQDPGNQIAAVDVRYGWEAFGQTVGVYTQMAGEDEAGAFPARKSWLFGVDATSQWFGAEQQWYAEYVNTVADDLFGDALPNVTYEHFQYRSGYNHFGRAIGSSFGGDSKALTLGGYHFLPGGGEVSATVSLADINVDGSARVVTPGNEIFYFVPQSRTKTTIVGLGYATHLFNGWLQLRAQLQDKEIEFVSGARDRWSLGGQWTYRF